MGNIKNSYQYKLTKNDITVILANHDPEEFMYMGAPADEYEPEAKLIDNFCRQYPDKINSTDLSAHIKYVFEHMFGSSEITNDKSFHIATDIINMNLAKY